MKRYKYLYTEREGGEFKVIYLSQPPLALLLLLTERRRRSSAVGNVVFLKTGIWASSILSPHNERWDVYNNRIYVSSCNFEGIERSVEGKGVTNGI
jgi:hypothetical protein